MTAPTRGSTPPPVSGAAPDPIQNAPRTSPAGPTAPLARTLEVARVSGVAWAATLALDGVLDRALRRVRPWSPLRLWPDVHVTAPELEAQLARILEAWGMPPADAALTASLMLYADLRAIDSHGCAMLATYHRSWRAGHLAMAPSIEIVRETETTALIDGGGGLGHVPAHRAMTLAVGKARASGVGAVAVRNSGHYGAAGAYAAMASDAGQIGFATTTTPTRAVVPTRGREPRLGTNPIAFAASAGARPPFVLDMATSTAPLGKLAVAWREGRRLPAGWALDARGRPQRSPAAALAGRSLTPLGSREDLGSHKGYGLATMVEVLAAGLAGATPADRSLDAPRRRVEHFFLALDPARFRAVGDFERDVGDLADHLRASPPAVDGDAVLVAGDPERDALARRTQDGIPLARAVVEELRAVAVDSDVPFRLDPRAHDADPRP